MIEIKNVTVVKSGRELFKDLSWQIAQGDNWVISGPNGSGKSLLLEVLGGSLHVPKGTLHYSFVTGASWDERHLEKRQYIRLIPAHAIQAFVSDQSSLYYQQRYYAGNDNEAMLVRDILGNELHQLASLKIPTSLSVDHLLSLDVTRLSNGQLKKVLLLKSLVSGIPKLLLLDYPFEGLDGTSRQELCDFIDFIATQFSITIILTDHSHHLPSVINKRLILKDFKIVREENVYEDKQAQSRVDLALPVKDSDFNKEPVIEIKNLLIRYGQTTILENFSWTVRRGERWALIGHNGAGKTTLFSMIFADHPMGYTQQIALFGRRRGSGESIWDIKKRISYVGPELISYLNPKHIFISAREYVKSMSRTVTDAKLDELIDWFGAAGFFHRPVQSLSSGQLQLMEIINSFSSDKELLLLDEPFQFLDSGIREKVSRYIQSHLHPHTTLILITHYAADVRTWGEMIKEL